MKRKWFWISSVVWLFAVLGLFVYKYYGISYPAVGWKRIVDMGLMVGIPVLLLGIGCLWYASKKKSKFKRCAQYLLFLLIILVSLTDLFLLSIVGVYSSTKSLDRYLIPDRDVVLDPVVYSIFPEDLQKVKSCDYWYVRGKSWLFFDGNGWRIGLSATYDPKQYKSEIGRLQDLGMLSAPRRYAESIDEYAVSAYDRDSVRINVLVSEKNRQIIYYAQYLDLAKFSKEDVLHELINNKP